MTDDILTYERRVWDALMKGDAAADTALLHAAFMGVYPDGVADRSAHAGQLAQGPSIAAYSLSEVIVKPLGDEHALICYRATFRRTTRDSFEQMFVSSIWQRQDDGWINIFSQDTPAR